MGSTRASKRHDRANSHIPDTLVAVMWRVIVCFGLVFSPTMLYAAPPIVVSTQTDNVAVTIYRDPSRGELDINTLNPNAFALISETRTLDLPPGAVTIRFEGVAGGIVPQSAIIVGTKQAERNRDAALLSQGGLVDAFTGQEVILKRTNRATGVVTQERATIRSAADRMIISTPEGSQAVYCTGLSQTLIYPGAPTTLSAKPVLTMTTVDQPGGKITVSLAYLATGFDWNANYVATLAGDGKSLSLFSWLTMVSGDETSFVDATTSVVAGDVNRSDETRDDTGRIARAIAQMLDVKSACWPNDTTSTAARAPSGYPPPPPPPPPEDFEVVIVTGTKRSAVRQNAAIAVTAVAEKVGDLVLYKIPVPVTVAARSQKQVAFLADKTVKGALIYRVSVDGDNNVSDLDMLFRFTNNARSGLGDPLPAGLVTLYQETFQGRHLLGEIPLTNKTTDEEVELKFGLTEGVQFEADFEFQGGRTRHKISNANPFPIRFELEFLINEGSEFRNLPRNLISKPAKRVWSINVPAYGTRSMTYNNN